MFEHDNTVYQPALRTCKNTVYGRNMPVHMRTASNVQYDETNWTSSARMKAMTPLTFLETMIEARFLDDAIAHNKRFIVQMLNEMSVDENMVLVDSTVHTSAILIDTQTREIALFDSNGRGGLYGDTWLAAINKSKLRGSAMTPSRDGRTADLQGKTWKFLKMDRISCNISCNLAVPGDEVGQCEPCTHFAILGGANAVCE
jgi:hypothetical protein